MSCSVILIPPSILLRSVSSLLKSRERSSAVTNLYSKPSSLAFYRTGKEKSMLPIQMRNKNKKWHVR